MLVKRRFATACLLAWSPSTHDFHFWPPGRAPLYTHRSRQVQVSSSHVLPAPKPRQRRMRRRETDWSTGSGDILPTPLDALRLPSLEALGPLRGPAPRSGAAFRRRAANGDALCQEQPVVPTKTPPTLLIIEVSGIGW